MKTKTLKKNKINIITLGCSKNLVDSEVLFSQLKANKMEVEHESSKNDANVVVINTCGFIENAKQESIDTILRYADQKEVGNIDKLINQTLDFIRGAPDFGGAVDKEIILVK